MPSRVRRLYFAFNPPLCWSSSLADLNFTCSLGILKTTLFCSDMLSFIHVFNEMCYFFCTLLSQMFDVVSTPNPINIAYSSVGLSYHIDLAYYESPPGLQLLHCLR